MRGPNEQELNALRRVETYRRKVATEVDRLMVHNTGMSEVDARLQAEKQFETDKPSATDLGLSIDAQVYKSTERISYPKVGHPLDRLNREV